MINRLLGIALLIVTVVADLTAQESADFLRSTGKIYSVVAGILVLFLLIVIYLIRLDRKITKLEKDSNS